MSIAAEDTPVDNLNTQPLIISRRCNRLGKSRHPIPRGLKPIKEKFSVGVACCRWCGTRPQILLVQKRCTYAYSMFVRGIYDASSVSRLLCGMTNDEKLIIQSMDFASIWYLLWLNDPMEHPKYAIFHRIFDNNFKADQGLRLKDLITRSTSTIRVWEIPKGRKRKGESNIHTAIREFNEETGIQKQSYYLFPTATRTLSFIDDGVKYTATYYIAFMRKIMQPKVDLGSHQQTEEISDIRWMDIAAIKYIDPTMRLANLVKPIFNYIKNHVPRA